MLLTSAQLRTHILAAGITAPSILTADATYKAPLASWLLREFDQYFRQYLTAMRLQLWAAENWDCDDFSDLYAVLAKICHRRTPGSDGTGLPVGVIWYMQEGVGAHSIVSAFTSDLGLIFIEPQRARTRLMPTPQEKGFAWLAKF